MGDLLPLFILVDIALLAAALFDCITTDESAVRSLPKLFWIVLILFIPTIGAIMWFVAGRPASPQAAGPGAASWTTGGTSAERGHPSRRAPDDDPEFLSTLAADQQRRVDRERRDDEERLRKWEADLRLREERLRRDGEPPVERD